jgi:hypothetical protein
MNRSRNSRWLRAAALVAALAAVLIGSTASLLHYDSPGAAATCPICHVANVSPLPAAATRNVFVYVVLSWMLLAQATTFRAEPASFACSPRAPPAALLLEN